MGIFLLTSIFHQLRIWASNNQFDFLRALLLNTLLICICSILSHSIHYWINFCNSDTYIWFAMWTITLNFLCSVHNFCASIAKTSLLQTGALSQIVKISDFILRLHLWYLNKMSLSIYCAYRHNMDCLSYLLWLAVK